MNRRAIIFFGVLTLFLLSLIICISTVKGESGRTVNEGQSNLLLIRVESPSEVMPGQPFQINFTLSALRDSGVTIAFLRVEFWAMGSYNDLNVSLVDSGTHIGRGGKVEKNMTFTVDPTAVYPNIVMCYLHLQCGVEGNFQEYHYRFTLSYCTPFTYQELMEAVEEGENDLNDVRVSLDLSQADVQRFRAAALALAVSTTVFAASTIVIRIRHRRTRS